MRTLFRSSWLTGLCLVLLTLSACKKEEPTATPTVTPPLTTVPPPPTGLVLQDRVSVLDTVHYQLTSSAAELMAGTYKFGYSGTLPDFKAADVILGAQQGGFLRRVTGLTVQAGTVSFQTTQATMEDAFKSGTLTLGTDINGLHRGTSASWSFSLNNQSIYNSGPLSLTLTSGQIEMSSDWNTSVEFESDHIKHFVMGTKGGSISGNFALTARAAQAISLVNQTSTLKHVSKTYTKWIPATIGVIPVVVPITVEMDLDLVLQYSASVDAAIIREATFNTTNTFDLGAEYINKQWQGIYAFAPTNTFSMGQRTGNANGTVNFALIPKVSFKFFGVAGPYAAVGLQEEMKAGTASPSLDWNFKADVWLHTTAGADVTILGKSLANYSKSWDTPKLTYNTPDQLVRTSGDNQTGTASQELTQPLRVQVLDSKGSPQSDVPVYFTPAVDDGTASPVSVLTDANGYAESSWTLGSSTTTTQHLAASVKTSTGQDITNAPIDFGATATAGCLPGNQVQFLTGGNSKTWRLTQLVVDDSGRNTYDIYNATATSPILYIYSVDGRQYTGENPCLDYATHTLIHCDTPQIITETFCPYFTNEQIRFLAVKTGVGYSTQLISLTANKLIVVKTEPDNVQTYTLVSP